MSTELLKTKGEKPLAPARMPVLSYDPGLDGLRALAVLAVLAFHLDIPALNGGFIGVDIFYIISGYLITRIVASQIEDDEFNYLNFIVKRARRLLPALLVTIVITLIGAFLLMSPRHFSGAATSGAFAAFSLSNWYFWLDSNYFALSKHVRPLLHTWSLGVEVQFYLVWPVVLHAVIKRKTEIQRLALMIAFAFVSFAAAVWAQNLMPSATFYLSPFRIWQFASGGCVALFAVYFLPRMSDVIRLGAFASGLALLTASFYLLSSSNYSSLSAALPTLATGLILLGLGTPAAQKLLGVNPIVFVGKISYSLYLVHWPVIILYRYWAYRPLEPVEMLGCALVSIFLAILLYHYVENRFRRPWSQRVNKERVVVGTRLAATMSTLGLIAGSVQLQSGWDWRLPDATRASQVSASSGNLCSEDTSVRGQTWCDMSSAATSSDELVIIGDSHALALAHGLSQTAAPDDAQTTLVLRYGTLPFHGVTTFGGEWETGNFGSTFDVVADSEPDIVVLHARFDQYWWSQDASSRWPTWLSHDPISPQAIEPSQATFRSGLEDTLAILKATRSKVIVVGAVPYPGLDSGQCLLRPRFLISDERSDRSCQGYSRDQSVKRAGEVNQVIREKVESSGFQFVDPTEVFCSDEKPTCARSHDGKLIYADDNHLNQIGANMLARAVRKKLAAPKP